MQLAVTVWVEADDNLPDDFPRRAMSAVRDCIKVGRSRHPELTITVQKVVEDKSGAGEGPSSVA